MCPPDGNAVRGDVAVPFGCSARVVSFALVAARSVVRWTCPAIAEKSAPRWLEVVETIDGWEAVELLLNEDFDLALCAVKFDEWSGARIYKMVANVRPRMAARIVFVADEATVNAAPPSSALGRLLRRPVDPGAVKRLLDEWRSP